MDESKTLADYAGITEKLFDFGRSGLGYDVKILWRFAYNQIAHGPANDIGVIATFP